jgi:hypothetical protein
MSVDQMLKFSAFLRMDIRDYDRYPEDITGTKLTKMQLILNDFSGDDIKE